MLSFDSQTFTWLGRRLMSYAKGGTTTNYTYNSDGIRTKKVSGSTTTDYCLNGTQVLAEKRGSTLINYFYTSDGTRVGFKTGGKVYYYVYNLQGDVTHIVDESKNIAATYRYDPFGKILNLSSLTNIGKLNPFRYRGYYYDTESNLYYLNSRYYNPEIGRFINADGYVTTGQGVLSSNMFAYCMNNPVKYYDHSGTMTFGLYFGVGLIAIIGCSVEIGFCIDDKGDFVVVYDYSIPDKKENLTVGIASGGGYFKAQLTNSNSVFDLEGYSSALGLSNGFFEYAGFNLLVSNKDKIEFPGFEASVGAGFGIDAHWASSNTKIINARQTKTGRSMNNLKKKVDGLKDFFERIA